MSPGDPADRVRITSPRTGRHRPPPIRSGAAEIDGHTRIGQIYLDSLIRSQLRLAMIVLTPLLTLMLGLPVILRLFPAVARWQLFGLPTAWAVLGLVSYPLMMIGGWWYVRAAERNEDAFADVIERP